VDRTVRLELHPTPEQAQALFETRHLFTAAFNHVCRVGWQQREPNGVRLHHETYSPLKAQFPELVSDLHIQARVKATEAVKAALARTKKRRKVSCPRAGPARRASTSTPSSSPGSSGRLVSLLLPDG
jgi:putative transposase